MLKAIVPFFRIMLRIGTLIRNFFFFKFTKKHYFSFCMYCTINEFCVKILFFFVIFIASFLSTIIFRIKSSELANEYVFVNLRERLRRFPKFSDSSLVYENLLFTLHEILNLLFTTWNPLTNVNHATI